MKKRGRRKPGQDRETYSMVEVQAIDTQRESAFLEELAVRTFGSDWRDRFYGNPAAGGG